MSLTEVDFPNCKINVDNLTTSQIDMTGSGFVVLFTPDGLRQTRLDNNYYSNLTPNQFIIEIPRAVDGDPYSFSLIQPNNNACVDYTDNLNSTQCVLSSLGIINSGLVNGEYIEDVSHYKRSDIKISSTISEINYSLTATSDRINLDNSTDLLGITANNLYINNVAGTAGQVLSIDNSTNKIIWSSIPAVYPQVVVIDLSANYTITGINNLVYNLWAKTSAAGQQTIFLPTSGMTIGQTIIIRSEADSSSINSGTGNLIYRSITASELVVISQASCVQFCLGSIEGSVYNWFVVSTS